jgi:hypothetical protein
VCNHQGVPVGAKLPAAACCTANACCCQRCCCLGAHATKTSTTAATYAARQQSHIRLGSSINGHGGCDHLMRAFGSQHQLQHAEGVTATRAEAAHSQLQAPRQDLSNNTQVPDQLSNNKRF